MVNILFPSTQVRKGPVRILFVCTGNICRSPLAEVLLRYEMGDLPVIVSSAGTHAYEGYEMALQNQLIAEANCVEDAHSHVSCQLTREMVKESDLVLALSRDHRKYIVNLVPSASRYVFTLREFARLAQAYLNQITSVSLNVSVEERMRDAVQSAIQLRGTLPLLDDPNDDDVIDPYHQDVAVYKESAQQLIPATKTITTLLQTAVTEVK